MQWKYWFLAIFLLSVSCGKFKYCVSQYGCTPIETDRHYFADHVLSKNSFYDRKKLLKFYDKHINTRKDINHLYMREKFYIFSLHLKNNMLK